MGGVVTVKIIRVWIIQKLALGLRLKTKVSFKKIRGRAKLSSLLSREDLSTDRGGEGLEGRGRIGDREEGKGLGSRGGRGLEIRREGGLLGGG